MNLVYLSYKDLSFGKYISWWALTQIESLKSDLKQGYIDIDEYSKKLNTDIYTLQDIVECLKKPNRDPRDSMAAPILKSDILHIEDLRVGMKLQGTVRNISDFGVFVDIGLKNDGMIHRSKLSKTRISHPSEVVSVGDIVDCYVDDISLEKGKVSLSLLER